MQCTDLQCMVCKKLPSHETVVFITYYYILVAILNSYQHLGKG